MDTLVLKDLLIYESSIGGKITKRPFISKGYRNKECLELVYTDVYENFRVHAWWGYRYFITFIDYYFKYGYMYLVDRKFDDLDIFIEFKAKSDTLSGKYINALLLDQGGKYISSKFDSFLRKHVIIS